MARPKQTLVASFRSAFRGIGHQLKERNFIIQITIGVVVCILSFILALTVVELMVIALLFAFVLSTEAVNSACERMLDFITTEQHPEVGRIKEVLAASVLINSIIAALIGILIFGNAILRKI